MEITALLED